MLLLAAPVPRSASVICLFRNWLIATAIIQNRDLQRAAVYYIARYR
jgi:hypothetical protein